jgi:hypothetical protein
MADGEVEYQGQGGGEGGQLFLWLYIVWKECSKHVRFSEKRTQKFTTVAYIQGLSTRNHGYFYNSQYVMQ